MPCLASVVQARVFTHELLGVGGQGNAANAGVVEPRWATPCRQCMFCMAEVARASVLMRKFIGEGDTASHLSLGQQSDGRFVDVVGGG